MADEFDKIDWKKIKVESGVKPDSRQSKFKQLRDLLQSMKDGQSCELPVKSKRIKNDIVNSLKACAYLSSSRYVTRSTLKGLRIFKLAKEAE
ncbi:MAG: hypothetical protein QM703_22850 [Gemmatales bacterium]